MNDVTAHFGILYVDLFIGSAQSLKQKRMVLRSLKDRVRQKFNASISELGGQDKWQVCTLGIAMIGSDKRHMDACLQHILSFIVSYHAVDICQHDIEFF
ncbi:MAG: DUF503 domain-containing protein [Candidatus Omnitrophica bacterium]|nr:DUF503 domain-containing protein [Candidatus Omnitrophota bacterium]